jgi:hypothetical protein
MNFRLGTLKGRPYTGNNEFCVFGEENEFCRGNPRGYPQQLQFHSEIVAPTPRFLTAKSVILASCGPLLPGA